MAAAGAQIVGGMLQIGAQREAANERRNSTNYALQIEQQREAERQRRATQNEEARRLAFLNYYDRYGEEAIDRYGIPAGIDPAILPQRRRNAGRPGGKPPAPTGVVPTTQPTARPQGMLGPMDSQQPNTNPSAMSSQPFNWNEWERYL